MRIESVLTAAAFILVLTITSSCESSAKTTSVSSEVASLNRIIAKLNGDPIFEQEFDEFITSTQGELSEDPQPVPKRELFAEFLTRKLLLQEAEKAGVEADEARVEECLRQWTAREVDEARRFTQYVRDFLKVQKFVSEQIRPAVDVSLPEILRYYEQNAEQFVLEDQAHVLEILTRDRSEAEQIRRELEDGDIRDFKERARRYSAGVTAATGGDLGFFQRGDLPEEFESAIFSLKPGQLSDPFESDHGFHIFLIEEWIPRHAQKFFEVRAQIFEILVAEKERAATKAVLNKMLGKASIEIYDSSLEFFLEERSSHEEDKKLD